MTDSEEEEHLPVEIIVLNVGGEPDKEELPEFVSPEVQEERDHEAAHQAIHALVEIRNLTQAVAEAEHMVAEHDGSVAASDQANAALHEFVGKMPINRLRNTLLIAVAMIDPGYLRAGVEEYCGPAALEEEDGDE